MWEQVLLPPLTSLLGLSPCILYDIHGGHVMEGSSPSSPMAQNFAPNQLTHDATSTKIMWCVFGPLRLETRELPRDWEKGGVLKLCSFVGLLLLFLNSCMQSMIVQWFILWPLEDLRSVPSPPDFVPKLNFIPYFDKNSLRSTYQLNNQFIRHWICFIVEMWVWLMWSCDIISHDAPLKQLAWQEKHQVFAVPCRCFLKLLLFTDVFSYTVN